MHTSESWEKKEREKGNEVVEIEGRRGEGEKEGEEGRERVRGKEGESTNL